MRRVIILVVLVAAAGVAGVVVRSSSGGGSGFKGLVSRNEQADTREEIRQTYELAPGARVELSNLNGAVKIETSDSTTAEVLVERTGSQEALARRIVTVEADANSLRIRVEKGDVGFFSRIFGSKASENVTLKLPRKISLYAKGVNGSVSVGELDGPVDVRGVNGRVHIAATSGTADFKGVNGNIVVGLNKLDAAGVSLKGINGNIELQLGTDVNADLATKGMNGRVLSDVPGVAVDESKRGNYSARIGSGGSSIQAKGINGNIRLTRASMAQPSAEVVTDKLKSTEGQ